MVLFSKRMPLGVQSWCFRNFKTNPEVIAELKNCGLDAIELCDVHVDVNDGKAVEECLKLYRESGVAITSFGISGFSNSENSVRPLFEFARKAGFSTLGADPDPDAFGLLEKLCLEYSVKLAIHNHGRRHRYGTFAQLEEVFAGTSRNIGLCLDTAWMLDAGEDPIAAVTHFAGRLHGIHIKDFVFERNGSPLDVVVGTGNLDLKKLSTTLRAIDFKGYATLEYEGKPDDPAPDIRECAKMIKETFL